MIVKEYGYEYDASLDAPLFEKTKNKVTTEKLWGALCLRSGRDALKVVAREYEPTTVFMPALSCDSMVLPFEMYGHTIRYYRLTEDYTIDIDSIEKHIGTENAIFLFMDYFGVPAISDDDLHYLKSINPSLVFVEDRTHNLLQEKTRSFVPDFTVASLRKWVNVPDGGLLWTDIQLKNDVYSEDTSFMMTRLNAQCLRRQFFESGDISIKQEYRKIFSTVSDILDDDKTPGRMSAYSYGIARNTNWHKVRLVREENAKHLISILKSAGFKLIQNSEGFSDLYVAFKVVDRERKQAKLSQLGIFNTIIWPLSDEQKEACSVAKNTDETMLAAPCDQRYSVQDMEYIGREIVRVFNE